MSPVLEAQQRRAGVVVVVVVTLHSGKLRQSDPEHSTQPENEVSTVPGVDGTETCGQQDWPKCDKALE